MSEDDWKDGIHPARYRKRPVTVEAVRYLPGIGNGAGVTSRDALPESHPAFQMAKEQGIPEDTDWGWIGTLEGGHIAEPEDWIITGVEGERYPCKPRIFEATYQEVGNSPILSPQAVLNTGFNVFALQIVAESVLRFPDLKPFSFVFPVEREDTKPWSGLRFMLEPVRTIDLESDPHDDAP